MAARKLFGTDGVRGKANTPPMTAEVAMRIGMAAGRLLTRGEHRHTVVIGKDTRLSGYMLEPAMTAGFVSMGMDVILVGPMPTPAIAMLTRSLRADLGVMLSASHNPYDDNGIKLFGPDGYKLSDDDEAQIEALMENGLSDHLAAPAALGRARRLEDAPGRYIEFVKNTFPRGLRLDGLKIVIDCAHGAGYKVAPQVLWELGAEIIPLGVKPDGFNINKGCGSLHTDALCEAVQDAGAHIGIALDGDADRLIVCDEKGHVVDGDQLLALIAGRWKAAGTLAGDTVVATVMSNLGLERHLAEQGIALKRSQVGDRYVVEDMRAGDFVLGGEQSGHIVLGHHATTGDGLMAALQVLAALVEARTSASQLLRRFTPAPQILKNVRFADRKTARAALDCDPVRTAVQDAEARFNGSGRLLIRPSGTEPLVRVMAEGDDPAHVEAVVDDLAAVIAAQGASA